MVDGLDDSTVVTPGKLKDPNAINLDRAGVFDTVFPGSGNATSSDPDDFRVGLIKQTNSKGRRKFGKKWPTLSWPELLTTFGILLLMTCTPLPAVSTYFSAARDDFDFTPNLSKYQTYTRFKQIVLSLEWEALPEAHPDDPFKFVNNFVTKMNAKMRAVYTSGSHLVLDESMSQWCQARCPGWRGVPRKPVSRGHEIWTMCDVSRILIWAEISHGSKYVTAQFSDKAKEFVGKRFDGSHIKSLQSHSAVVMRAVTTAGVVGSGRIIIADAGFGSVATACVLFGLGLYFIGNVKGCS